MAVLQKGTQQESNIQLDDYNNFSSNLMDIPIWQNWYNYDLNTAAINHINKTGLTKFCIRNKDRDYNNVEPTQQYQNIELDSITLYVTYINLVPHEKPFSIDADVIAAPQVKGAHVETLLIHYF